MRHLRLAPTAFLIAWAASLALFAHACGYSSHRSDLAVGSGGEGENESSEALMFDARELPAPRMMLPAAAMDAATGGEGSLEGASSAERIAPPETSGASSLEAGRRLAADPNLRPRAPALLVRPDGPDLQELPLKAMRVACVMKGTRARMLIDCTFENTYAQELSGTLRVKLPDGATPAYLAMYQGTGIPVASAAGAEPTQDRPRSEVGSLVPPPLEPGSILEPGFELPASWSEPQTEARVDWGELRPARVTEAVQGRRVYESVTRQRIDPALMEWAGGNSFSTRIFPLPAGSHKRVVFAYDVPAFLLEGRRTVVLPVPRQLPEGFHLEAAVDADAHTGGMVFAGERTDALHREQGYDAVRLSGADLDQPGAVLLSATPQDSATSAGAFAHPDLEGTLVHARVTPNLPRATTEVATTDAVFLLDTSLSQRTRLHADLGALLLRVLETDDTIRRFQVIGFDVEARALARGWQANTKEARERMARALDSVWLAGATNLAAGLEEVKRSAPPNKDTTCFLLSDGQLTWGTDDVRELERAYPGLFGARWICYQVGDSAVNRPLFETLTRAGGRTVTLLSSDQLAAAARAHRTAPVALHAVRVEGVPAQDLVVAGDPGQLHPGQTIEVAFRVPSGHDLGGATVVVDCGLGVSRHPLTQARGTGDPLAGRAWAGLTVRRLLALHDEVADELALAISQRFGLVNRVASLLILETDAEYDEHQIAKAALDLPKLAKAALARDAGRPIGAPDLSSLAPEALSFIDTLHAAKAARHVEATKAKARKGATLDRPEWGEALDPKAVHRTAAAFQEQGEAEAALRIVSSLVEEHPRDARALRLVGFTLLDWGRYERAVELFERARRLRPFEPQAFLCEAMALQANGQIADAALRYELVLAGEWDPRWGGYATQTARRMYRRLLSELEGDQQPGAVISASRDRLGALELGSDLAAAHELHLYWSLDDTDVDLHVEESGFFGAHVYYSEAKSRNGQLHWDNTSGLGPEVYTHTEEAPDRAYVHYFGSRSVEGEIPAATLLVRYEPGRAAPHYAAAVLAEVKKEVTLFER